MKLTGQVTEHPNGSLTTPGFNFIMNQFEATKTPAGRDLAEDRNKFFKNYGAQIDKNYDPVMGSPTVYIAEKEAIRREKELKDAHIDPHLLYEPTSQYYFGAAGNIAKFQTSLQQGLSQPATPGAAVPKTTQRPVGFPDDAQPGRDGKWYVVRDGKRFRVDPIQAPQR